jgi:hypothetical protein
MSASDAANTVWAAYRALGEQFARGGSNAALAMLLLRLMVEVEALREALASPETPEAVRQSYRQAYARIAVLSHNAAGPFGGTEKVLRRFLPSDGEAGRFAPELAMLARLGASAEEQQALRDKLEEVEMYT